MASDHDTDPTAEGGVAPRLGSVAGTARSLTREPRGMSSSRVERIGDTLPTDVRRVGACGYLAWLPVGAGDDALRAAALLRDARMRVHVAPADLPDTLRDLDRLADYTRTPGAAIRAWLESVGAPSHAYDTFLRLCPGAIAPERR